MSETPPTETFNWEGDAGPAKGKSGITIRPHLIVLHGPDRGKMFRLDADRSTIGRNPQADILLYDERISRSHCALRVERGGVVVEDLGSSNGVFVNGERVQRALVGPDASLQLGRTVLRVTYKAEAEIEIEDELFKAATTDPLTRLPNRRWFLQQAAAEMAYAARHEVPLAVVMLDVDLFKHINDTYGHAAGDQVLSSLAALLVAQKRTEDLLCRYGGEEFLFLLRQTPGDAALAFCNRLRQAVEQQAFRFGSVAIPVTLSIGTARLAPGESLEALIRRADRAMYIAKSRGRNRAESAEAQPPEAMRGAVETGLPREDFGATDDVPIQPA